MTGTEPQSEIALWPEGAAGADSGRPKQKNEKGHESGYGMPTLEPFLVIGSGTAVIVFPGGGYRVTAVGHEGREPALWLNRLGISAFVLRYRLPATEEVDYRYPAPLLDAQRALSMVRARAGEWGVSTDRIGVLGFSAGGHLAALTLTHPPVPSPLDDEISRASCRPDFGILVYAVMSFTDPQCAHAGSRLNLTGPDAMEDLLHRLSPDENVDGETPPVFLAHARDDKGVSWANSQRMYDALVRAGVPAKLCLYDSGGHGGGLGVADTAISAWPDDCAAWLREMGLA